MALPKGLRVEVLVGEQALPMYDDPDAEDSGAPHMHTCYIEALTGVRFKVRVTMDSSFDWGGYTAAVRIDAEFDGDCWSEDIVRDKESKYTWWQGQAEFTSTSVYCKSSGQWSTGSLAFGALETKESSNMALDPARLESLGSIKVNAQRVVYTYYEPGSDLCDQAGQERVTEVSEKVLKGKTITNSVECVDQRPSGKPQLADPVKPISGSLGREYTTNILYRSRSTLQSLGCIPRSPSPEIEEVSDRNAASGNQGNAQDRQKRIQELKTRLALLERDTNIKSEPPTPNLKRERNSSDANTTRKRSRRSGSIEVVDLTAD